jgi:hypothetical protein
MKFMNRTTKTRFASLLLASVLVGHTALGATQIYRSVGTQATALATGAANAMTIAAATATFSSALPDNIGVGDVIQYDSANGASINSYAIISGRTSSTVYTVKLSNGTSNPTAVAANTSWSIFRAYNDIDATTRFLENGNIDIAVRNFDNFSSGSPRDLVALNEIYNIAVYADGVFNITQAGKFYFAPTTYVTADATHYVRMYAPYATTDVGTSQRHTGKWTTSAARIETSGAWNCASCAPIVFYIAFMRIEGIQFRFNTTGAADQYMIWFETLDNALTPEYHVSNCIFRGDASNTYSSHIAIVTYNGSGIGTVGSEKIYNNIFYDFNGGASQSSAVYLGDNDVVYAYNNTIHNVKYGFLHDYTAAGVMELKNNIVQGATDGYSDTVGSFGASSTNNLSNVAADSPGANPQDSKTVTFVDSSNADHSLRDFRLAAGDTAAKDAGTSLSGDAILPFTTDIENATRSGTWDIGACEYANANSMTIASLTTSNVTVSAFDAQLTYTGDANTDGACTFYYCNNTDSAGCNPTAGTNVGAMTRGSGVFTVSVSGLTNPNNPSDVLNIRAVCTDTDGMSGSPLNTTVTLAAAGVNSLTTSLLVTNSVTTTSFGAQITFAGDANTNGACTFYYCDNTASPGCDPTAGSSTAMTRGAGVFTSAISGLTNQNPGHQYNIRTVCADADGVSANLSSTVTLTSDTLAPKPPSPVTIE